MTTEEKVRQAGLDWDAAVGRFAGKEELYIKFLKKFADDGNFALLKEAWEQKNSPDTERTAHTLKGVCANLGMTDLSEACSRIVQAVRTGNVQDTFERDELIRDCEREYDKIWRMLNTLE